MQGELRPLLRLAIPLVLGELGWMTMGIVDTMMVGRVGAATMGGVGVGHILFITVALAGMGILLGLDPLVSQAHGAGRPDDAQKSLVNALWMSLPLAAVLMAAHAAAVPLLSLIGANPSVLTEAASYSRAVTFSTLPLLLYAALRRYLQGIGRVGPVMFALVSANLVNVAGNWALIFGNLGLPAMGAEGAAWATVLSRAYMALVLLVAALPIAGPWRPSWSRMRAIFELGLPASLQMCAEVGVFALATSLVAKLDAEQGAAHQVALATISYTFMVPLGLSAAAATRVGHCIGAGRMGTARLAGWTAIGIGVAFMAVAGLAMISFPRWIARAFTTDAAVIQAAMPMLAWGALFQLFDGAQGVAVGALRGAGRTRVAAIVHAVAYWAVGLPLSWTLCFRAGWGAPGMWAGLSIAIILIGAALTAAWHRETRTWRNQHDGSDRRRSHGSGL
jgi:MATE family multidrug resistance protein